MANLLDTIQAEGMLTTFTHMINMSEIVATLREPGAYTVFAPTDAAFAQMKAEKLEDLFEDYYNLSKLVKYHTVMGHIQGSRPARRDLPENDGRATAHHQILSLQRTNQREVGRWFRYPQLCH